MTTERKKNKHIIPAVYINGFFAIGILSVLSILKSKENLNYLFIFATSFLAIITDLVLTNYAEK